MNSNRPKEKQSQEKVEKHSEMDADDGNPFRSEEHHDRGSWNSPVTIG
jgi:hypothetical protein